jgi:hypothetical protein
LVLHSINRNFLYNQLCGCTGDGFDIYIFRGGSYPVPKLPGSFRRVGEQERQARSVRAKELGEMKAEGAESGRHPTRHGGVESLCAMTISVGSPSGPSATTCGYCSPPGRRSSTKSAAHAAGLQANQLSCQASQVPAPLAVSDCRHLPGLSKDD